MKATADQTSRRTTDHGSAAAVASQRIIDRHRRVFSGARLRSAPRSWGVAPTVSAVAAPLAHGTQVAGPVAATRMRLGRL